MTVARSFAASLEAAPPTPWSQSLVEPSIHPSAYVHSFSNIIGDVRIGENVMIAPGISIRADEGTPFAIGANTNIQDGVVIHGLEQGRILGDDDKPYSVWIGDNTSITHMALIHGPAYVGDNCFIGFRSTIFNAKVGDGCIVMMHALVQDVEIPAGKYVPSGAIITTQQQADRLSDVQPDDRKFASHIIHINDSLRSGYRCAEDIECIIPLQNAAGVVEQYPSELHGGSTTLSPEVVDNVRRLLAQGYKISTEHANKRRFQTSSWSSCAAVKSTSEAEALRSLESCLQDHAGEYVRLIGIEPNAKQRVFESIIQRPGDASPSQSQARSTSAAPASAHTSSTATTHSGTVGNDVATTVRQLLTQGCQIAVEHADKRRFQSGSWTSCGRLDNQTEAAVLGAIAECIANNPNNYVRAIGIDTHAKRRVAEKIVHRPGQTVAASGNGSNGTQSTNSFSTGSSSSSSTASASSTLAIDVVDSISSLLAQGCTIFTEFADERRYKSNAWESGTQVSGRNASEIVRAIESIVRDRQKQYVRLIGVDPKVRKRTLEKVIHRPVK